MFAIIYYAMAKMSQTNKRHTKKDMESKKFIAQAMYMAFEDNKTIAESVGVSAKTISEWAGAEKWKTKRSAGSITRDELINKCLASLNALLDRAIEGKEVGNIEDKLAKMAKTIEVLDRKNNIVYNIESFIGFNKYLMQRMPEDKVLSADLVKMINKLQNDYLTYRIGA